MGVQETAVVVGTLLVTPVAAIYSIARWDASKYVRIPKSSTAKEESQAEKKPSRHQGWLFGLALVVFMVLCVTAGYCTTYLPAWGRDAFIILQMCLFPAMSSYYNGALLTGTTHEVFARNDSGDLTRTCVRRPVLHRQLALLACTLLPLCTFYDVFKLPVMTLLCIGTIFSPSLPMGSTLTQKGPSLRSIIKWNAISATAVVALGYAVPLLINRLIAAFDSDSDKSEPAVLSSPITPWRDRAMEVYTVFVPAMLIGASIGMSISRLYRIDVANYRRKNSTLELKPDATPEYLVRSESDSIPNLIEMDSSHDNGRHAIRILSPIDIFTKRALSQLLCPPWYSGVAYLCLALLLNFAMPSIMSVSPIVKQLKDEQERVGGVVFERDAWISPNGVVALWASTYLILLLLPMHLAAVLLAFVRRESDFVWNHTADWAPFPSEDVAAAPDQVGADWADEKDVLRLVTVDSGED